MSERNPFPVPPPAPQGQRADDALPARGGVEAEARRETEGGVEALLARTRHEQTVIEAQRQAEATRRARDEQEQFAARQREQEQVRVIQAQAEALADANQLTILEIVGRTIVWGAGLYAVTWGALALGRAMRADGQRRAAERTRAVEQGERRTRRGRRAA